MLLQFMTATINATYLLNIISISKDKITVENYYCALKSCCITVYKVLML